MSYRKQRGKQQQRQQSSYQDEEYFDEEEQFDYQDEQDYQEPIGRSYVKRTTTFKDRGDDYYLEIYENFEQTHHGDHESAMEAFENWCMNAGMPEVRLSQLLNKVQIGPMDEEFDQENEYNEEDFEEDFEKQIVCFSSAFTLNDISKKGYIELKPDNNFKKIISGEDPVVVNVSTPLEATNGTYANILIYGASSKKSRSGKEEIKKSDANPYPLIARIPHLLGESQIGSLFSASGDPISLRTTSTYVDVPSVIDDCVKVTVKGKDTVHVPSDTEFHRFIESAAPDTPCTQDDLSYVLTKTQAEKYAKIFLRSMNSGLKCKASELRIIAEPAHDVYEEEESVAEDDNEGREEERTSKRGPKLTKFMGSKVGKMEEGEKEKNLVLSKLILSNAGMINPMSKSKDFAKVTEVPCAVTIKAEVWTLKRKEKIEKENNARDLLNRHAEDVTSSEEED